METKRQMWKRNWFLLALLAILTAGPLLSDTPIDQLLSHLPTNLLTAVILFLMSVSLDTSQMLNALFSPLPVILALLINLTLVPFLGLFLSRYQAPPEFQLGLLIATIVPTTLATAAVWTRRGHGNVAVTLLVIMLSNIFGSFLIPVWLKFGTGQATDFQLGSTFIRLFLIVVLPVALGQLSQLYNDFKEWAFLQKKLIGTIAQSGILLIILKTSAQYGDAIISQFRTGGLTSSLLWLIATIILLHTLALLLSFSLARLFQLMPDDQLSVMIAGSQKTLPIAIAIANFPLFANDTTIALLVIPPIIHHALQMIIDSWVVDYWRENQAPKVVDF